MYYGHRAPAASDGVVWRSRPGGVSVDWLRWHSLATKPYLDADRDVALRQGSPLALGARLGDRRHRLGHATRSRYGRDARRRPWRVVVASARAACDPRLSRGDLRTGG